MAASETAGSLTPADASAQVRVTACIVARHEEAVIGRCLASVAPVSDEIVLVHDGPCEDGTVEIAKSFDARVFVRPRSGNPELHTVFAYEQARGDWLLSLDADEFLSEEMAGIIPELIDTPQYAGWRFRWPMWDGERYFAVAGRYKPALFRRERTTLVGHLQSIEQIDGLVGDRDELLHHQPLYNNFTMHSALGKYRRWCRVQALELINPFAELAMFNYHGPMSWPWWRRVLNVCSPLWAVPSGVLHFALVMRGAPRGERTVHLRLAFYQGVYAVMLQLYVARAMYFDPQTRLQGLSPDDRGRRL
jgi:glycosyltransferase involved in cell wall biosynthesis